MSEKTSKQEYEPENVLSKLLGEQALELLDGTGLNLIEQVGIDVIRQIILDILSGKNLRDSTEMLTRSRIAALNIALTSLFVKGAAQSPDFVRALPALAAGILARKKVPKAERWLAQWMLGLTGKSVQNVLRDNQALLEHYYELYTETCNEVIANSVGIYGELTGTLRLGEAPQAIETPVDWLFMLYLLNAAGAETLTIRGSEKSSYGKLFEKLVLGSLLSILGFAYDESSENAGEGVFWLSTQGEKRESDATLLYKMGQGVRFDIGFIGRGNPEIILDKVSRFQRQEEIRGARWYMATIVIVDRLGKGSRVQELARQIGGSIVQMSASYWPQEVALLLKQAFGFEHPLINIEQSRIEDFLKEKLQEVPIESFLRNLSAEDLLENGQ
jgi:hypothetical protein